MKLYRTLSGAVLVKDNAQYLLTNDWDELINDDDLYTTLARVGEDRKSDTDRLKDGVLPPVVNQEIWAAGVTYYRSKVGRQERSEEHTSELQSRENLVC